MFYAAAQNKDYQCFLSEETALPMMHIDDLINGTVFFSLSFLIHNYQIQYMEADPARLTDRIYNMSAFKVTPKQTELAIKRQRYMKIIK